MKATITNLVQHVAQNVSDRLLHGIPRNLDLNYITDRILVMSHCALAPSPAYTDDGRKELQWNNLSHSNSRTNEKRRKTSANSPADVSTFLQNRHDGHALILSLSDSEPDDRSLFLLRRQLLIWNWESPGKQKSETPSLAQLLDLCYTIHAYLNLHSKNVMVISCANGKTRSAVVVACYLKFSRRVETSLHGFAVFLQHRCPLLDYNQAASHIPPSLIQFFRNFDELMELGDFANPKPLLLRAVALQGVPVDDKPCLDIWDSRQNHVYSSLWSEDSAQWADEEGFYRVNRILEGDFCLLCRFGGIYSSDLNDPSKVLFRYANSAGFLNSGTYEIPKVKVDMMRRYEMSFEEEDFLLTLILESYWDSPNPEPGLEKDSKHLPTVLQGYPALEQGWHLLTEHHATKPNEDDFQSLRSIFFELLKCPDHICKVALQLTNLDLRKARDMLISGPMREWWLERENGINADVKLDENDEYPSTFDYSHPIRPVTPELSCRDVLNILDDISETDSVDPPKAPQHKQHHFDIRYESVLFPNRGDIVDAFGEYSKDLYKSLERFPPVEPLRPRMPMHKRKRQRAKSISNNKKHRGTEESNKDEERAAALQLLEQINHTGVTLDDLLLVQRTARMLNLPERNKEYSSELETTTHEDEQLKGEQLQRTLEPSKILRRGSEDGGEDEDVEGFEVAEDGDVRGENDLFLGFVVKGAKPGDQEINEQGEDNPLKDDPEYSKYFKMLKMGLSVDMVKHALKRDGKDPTILELDPNKSFKLQMKPPDAIAGGNEPPLREDPLYLKYYRMLKMGLPMDAVKHAMKRDGCDPSIMDLDPEKSLKSQRGDGQDDAPPLRDDPEYSKYFKMLKMGLPMDAVKHSIKRDGKDPGIMDLDPEKSLKSQMKSDASGDGPALKDDPEYEKYFKMLKMGLPMGAVKNALQRDGKDPSIMDLDPNKSVKSQTEGSKQMDDGPPLKDDPEYEKYFKMLKMGLPMGAVKNALQRDGKDPSIMDLDPNRSIKSQAGGSDDNDDSPPLKDDPEYEKYFKMLKMGLPMGAVKNALLRDGKDPSVMDLDPNMSVKSQLGGGAAGEDGVDTGVPLKDDPEYSKYFKMIKMGLPPGAVKNALQRDGKDPSIMDLDPEKSIAFQLAKKGSGSSRPVVRKKAKKRVRRKKIYWTPIDPAKVVEGSLWSIVKGEIDMEKLSYDQTEFENLFTESTNPADKAKKDAAAGGASKKKETVQLIDGKRSMNGGIILARLKMSYSQIASMVNIMDAGDFDSTQLMALKEFLPNDEERGALTNYCNSVAGSQEEKEKNISALPACEKYMIAMMEVKNSHAKFDCMLFKVQFHNVLDELIVGINTVRKACNEVRNSERLRKMMAMILTLVNQINTGGDGNLALGFSLEALLKLGEAKAFDKKTSVLHYLAKLVRQNDESLLLFGEDLPTVPIAEGVVLDGLIGDMKLVNEQLIKVTETTITEADELETEGLLPEMPVLQDQAGDEKDKVDVEHGAVAKDNQQLESSETIPVVVEEDSDTNKNFEGEMAQSVHRESNQKMRTPMEVFVYKARTEVDHALKSLEELKDSYAGVLKYFGEDEKMPSNEFFGTLQKFINEFKVAAQHVEVTERAKLKEKLKKAVKAAANIKLLGDIAVTSTKSIQDVNDPGSPAELKGQVVGSSDDNESADAVVESAKAGDETLSERGRTNMGSLAAMAAAAATKRGKKKTERTDVGGLAAMAAKAALKRGQKKSKDGQGEEPQSQASGEKMVALNETSDIGQEDSNKQISPNVGNLAAMAALAASRRSQRIDPPRCADAERVDEILLTEGGEAGPSEDREGRRKDGSIAALAAEAAQNRKLKKAETLVPGSANRSPSIGGFIERTLAATAKLNKDGPSVDSSMKSATAESKMAKAIENSATSVGEKGLKLGGIAALAAMAATQRALLKSEGLAEELENRRPTIGGGVSLSVADAGGSPRKDSIASTHFRDAKTTGDIRSMPAASAAKTMLRTSKQEDVGEAMDARQDRRKSETEINLDTAYAKDDLSQSDPPLSINDLLKSEIVVHGRLSLGSDPTQTSRTEKVKKRSSSEEESGDENSSAGESTSSKKLKSSPKVEVSNREGSLDYKPRNVEFARELGNDRSMEFTEIDGEPQPSLPCLSPLSEEDAQRNGHQKDVSLSDHLLANEARVELDVTMDNAQARSTPAKMPPKIGVGDVEFSPQSNKGELRITSRENVLTQETDLAEEINFGQRFSLQRVEVMTDYNEVPQVFREQLQQAKPRKQLLPLQSEALSMSRRLDGDNTIEKMFDTSDDEVDVLGQSRDVVVEASGKSPDGEVDESGQSREDEASLGITDKASPEPDLPWVEEAVHGSETSLINDRKVDIANPLQRWFQSLGGSQEFSDSQPTKEKDEIPSSPKEGIDNDNLFASFFRQISGRDVSAKSLTADLDSSGMPK